jgi:hypothetical protein
VGLALFAVDSILEGLPPEHYLIFLPAAALFYATFYGEELLTEQGWRFRPLRIGLFVLAGLALVAEGALLLPSADPIVFWRDLAVPVMIVVALLLYVTGLLHGGADVKGLMAITLLVPWYPAFLDFPLLTIGLPALEIAYPFSLAVVTNAALAFVVAPLILLVYNAHRRDAVFPYSLFGYRVPIDDVPKFVWIMQGVRDGKPFVSLFPRRGLKREAAIEALRGAGVARVWVMPQLPFVVAMAASFVLTFVVGNLLLGFTMWVAGG